MSLVNYYNRKVYIVVLLHNNITSFCPEEAFLASNLGLKRLPQGFYKFLEKRKRASNHIHLRKTKELFYWDSLLTFI